MDNQNDNTRKPGLPANTGSSGLSGNTGNTGNTRNTRDAGNAGNTGHSGYSARFGHSAPFLRHYADGTPSVLRKAVVYTELRFYQRSDVLYQLTQIFCRRYLPSYGDRTVDQMIQAARSTKQNIVEGSSDGQTSTEVELKLLGIARGSNLELQEDYLDYLKRNGMSEWFGKNPRFDRLHDFCKSHSKYEDYEPLFGKMNDEELANMAICLCHQVDTAMAKYIAQKDRDFTENGGIRERMTAARLEQRETQKEIIQRQAQEIQSLRQEVERLRTLQN